MDSAIMIAFFDAILRAVADFLESPPIFYLYVLVLGLIIIKYVKVLIGGG